MGVSIKVLVLQDRALVRAGLVDLLKRKKDINVVGEAGTGISSIQLACKKSPDVVLMDLRSAVVDDLQTCRLLREKCPKAKIIMLTENEEADVFAALSAAADGYCVKEAGIERISSAIRTVASGEFWMDPAIAKRVVKALLDTMAILASGAESSDSPPEVALSARESEVLALVSQGLSNQEIATELKISAETVKSHIRNIMKKLSVSDRTQAAVEAIKRGLI